MFRPVVINDEVCNGCNLCVEICPMDILEANSVKGRPPLVRYPEECCYDGVCFERCPLGKKGAIKVIPPLPMRVSILRG
jgi:NAD-dependent dihydropyrimidine dehydrogenase PreA subunit